MMHRTALPSPPVAKRVQTRREHHGDVFVDMVARQGQP